MFAIFFAIARSLYIKNNDIEYFDVTQKMYSYDLIIELVFITFALLVLALKSGIFFTLRKSKKFDLSDWTNTTKKMLLNTAIPLLFGGVFCVALLYHQLFALIVPVSLLFYGLALVDACKFTFSEIRYLGACEIVLGRLSLFYLGLGLVFWVVGFGILHILYEIIVFKKYR